MPNKAKECLTVKKSPGKMGRTEESANSQPPTQSTEVPVTALPISDQSSKSPQAGRRLLTVRQVQDVCRVSRRTVYNWMNGNRVEWADGLTRRYIYEDSIPLLADFRVSDELTVYNSSRFIDDGDFE